MQELIKIQKSEIGAEITNSVNARELHKTLEVRKDFSNWIKNQINRAGLEEDKDFILLAQKGEQLSSGSKWMTEYILTTDGAKHIAMISNTPKGKEVRDYLIEVEKRYLATLRNNGTDIQPFLMEMLKSNQETTRAVVEMGNIIINLNNNLTKLKTEVKEDMERISHNIGSVAVVTSAANRTCENVMSQNMEVLEVVNKLEIYYRKDGLTSEQKKLIREKIRQRAEYYSKQFKMKANDLEPLIYIKLRDRFDVKIYDEIKSEQFPMALRFLDSIPFTYEDMGE